jgi:hypothetical protein
VAIELLVESVESFFEFIFHVNFVYLKIFANVFIKLYADIE